LIRRCVTALLRRAEVIVGSGAVVADGVPDPATPVGNAAHLLHHAPKPHFSRFLRFSCIVDKVLVLTAQA
jgi:hypothetical protein